MDNCSDAIGVKFIFCNVNIVDLALWGMYQMENKCV